VSTDSRVEAALAQLAGLGPLTELGLRFAVLAPHDGGPRAHRVRLGEGVGADIAGLAEKTRTRTIDFRHLAYGPATLIPSGHCMTIGQNDAGTLADVQAEVDGDDMETFDPGAEYAAKATMLAARFASADGAAVTFYRVRETLLQLTERKSLNLILRRGHYERLAPGDVLIMSGIFDAVVIAGIAFFFAKQRFEQAFGFTAELARSSGETFDLVTTNLRIKGIEQLRQACTTQPAMMAKMASIRRSIDAEPAYAAAMTMPRLTAFVRERPNLGIEIEGTGADEQLVYNPARETRWKLLNLLDDDFLRSHLTERDYEAGSKIRT